MNNGTVTQITFINIYIYKHINYMADIFTKQVYVEKVHLTFELKPTLWKLE